MKLIGISGKAGSGKDTVADYLFEKYGFLKIAFADPLKSAASDIFGVNLGMFYDRDAKEEIISFWGKSPRQMAQDLGQQLKPVFGEDLWLKRWFLSYQQMRDTDHVVVPDARFDLECAAIRQLGGTIIHLVRPGAGLQGELALHPSEAGVTRIDGDWTIVNDGTKEQLYRNVELVLGKMKDE